MIVLIILLSLLSTSLSVPAHAVDLGFSITSAELTRGSMIAKKYTGEGEDVSPAVSWTGIPAGTKQLALICDDPDAPQAEPWVHWMVYSIPLTVKGLPEAIKPTETVSVPGGVVSQGKNSFGTIGYRGPMPPPGHGPHRYYFRLYALSAELNLPPGATRAELATAMKGKILAIAHLIGRYERK